MLQHNAGKAGPASVLHASSTWGQHIRPAWQFHRRPAHSGEHFKGTLFPDRGGEKDKGTVYPS
jgi:hypothetical protein